jgi:hypothetical protein
MKFEIVPWSLLHLYKNRSQISFPIFQRELIWPEGKKRTLIDSVFKGIDIPKLYLHKTKEGWDCIDGHQRINAIVGFFDGEFEYEGSTFDDLNDEQKRIFEDYKLTIAIAISFTDEEIRMLFTRLNLGIPLNAGEKLNAIRSNMGEFVRKMAQHPFIVRVSLPERRYAKEQVCAQICNNSLVINRTGEFRSSKYEDLESLYRMYSDFDLDSKEFKFILSVLDTLWKIFADQASEITNRASVVSIYLLVEKMIIDDEISGKEEIVKKFYIDFLTQLREEVRKGLDAENRFLISYQSRIMQAADSKSSVIERDIKLNEAFNYYVKTGSIIGYK